MGFNDLVDVYDTKGAESDDLHVYTDDSYAFIVLLSCNSLYQSLAIRSYQTGLKSGRWATRLRRGRKNARLSALQVGFSDRLIQSLSWSQATHSHPSHFSGSRTCEEHSLTLCFPQSEEPTNLGLSLFTRDSCAHEDGHIMFLLCRHDVVRRRQEGDVGDLEPCLLEDLSGGAGLEGFTILEMAPGERVCAYVEQ